MTDVHNSHLIPPHLVVSLTSGPSDTRVRQVAAMQNYIQELLGDTHHTFLQGSYRNDTATSDINDVDIVAVRLTTFSGVHSNVVVSSHVAWEQIFSEIEWKLRNQTRYTWTVERGDKCIKVRGVFNADVVPAVQVDRDHGIDPIAIYSFREGVERVNYPRLHYQNGVAKNASTSGLYKPSVRMFKNWRENHFGEDYVTASSFKVESLVHGSKEHYFSANYPANFIVIGHDILGRLGARTLAPTVLSVCGSEDITANWHPVAKQNFVERLSESLAYAEAAYRARTITEAETNWRLAMGI